MRKFFKDFFIYGFASVIGKIAAIFLMPIYTSILTKEEYGAMALIMSCQGIIGLVSNLNIHSGIARDYYEYENDRKRLVSTGFISILLISMFILVVMMLTRDFWIFNVLELDKKYVPAFMVMLCTIPSGSLQSYFAILTRFKKKSVLYSFGMILQLSIQIALSIIGVVYLRAGIISIFFAFLVSELCATLFFAYINRAYIGLFYYKKYIKRALLFSLPTLPAILAGWLDSSLGQVMIGRNVSMEDLGVYSVSLSIASAFTLVSTALQNVWSPYLYENYKTDGFKDEVQRIFSLIVIILLGISVTLSLFSKEIVLLLSNSSYLDACRYITLLCVPMCFYLLFPIATSGISISRETKFVGYSYVLGGMLNMSLLFILIEKYGVISVPICLAISRVTTYVVLYMVSERNLKLDLPNHYLLLLIVVIMLCYVHLYLNTILPLRLLSALIIYIVIVYLAINKIKIRTLITKFSI